MEDLDEINKFIAHLAFNGLLPGNINDSTALQSDIQDLLSESDFDYAYSYGKDDYIYQMTSGDVVLCKSWISKKWEKTKKFCKKHKKAILIGVAVVAAVAIVVGAVAAISSAAAAGAGAAASGDSDKKPHHEPDPAQSQAETLDLSTVINETISDFKEMVVEDDLLQIAENPPNQDDPSLVDKARELGSFLAHETLQAVTEVSSLIPISQLAVECSELSSKLFPESFSNPNDLNTSTPKDALKQLIVAGHEKIDELFATDNSGRYPIDRSRQHYLNFVSAQAPLPGSLGSGVAMVRYAGRIEATQALATKGWKIGDPIQNRTKFGFIPRWGTVRRRYWKNQAEWAKSNPDHHYGEGNISRMEKGMAPQRINLETGRLESMELHHDPAQRNGGLFDFIEVWPAEHAALDPKRHVGH